MYRKIVVALDPDGRALHAFPIVTALARQSEGEVWVVTVGESPNDADLSPAVKRGLEHLIASGAHREVVAAHGGSVASALAEAARRHQADLVVLGSHGRSTLGSVLRGSVGVSLAAELDLPLVLVHDGHDDPEQEAIPGPIRRVLVAVDSFHTSDAAIDAARDLAAEHGAAVMAAHVLMPVQAPVAYSPLSGSFAPTENDDEGAALLAEARRRLAEAGTAVETRLLQAEGSVAARIADTAEQWGADVILVGSRRLTPVGGLLAGSVTRDLVRRTHRPVLLAGRHAEQA